MSWKVAPVLVVENLGQSVAYYQAQLGFELLGSFGEPMEMAFVGRGGVQMMLQDAEGKQTPGPNAGYKSVAWDALFWVADVQAVHRQMRDDGASIRSEPAKTFYGTLEFQATDPDGHVLCFCELT